METYHIDEAIERYVRERMARGKEEADSRFLSLIHMRYQGKELKEFLAKTAGLVHYYIDYFRVMVNPLKSPELAFLATAIAMGVYGILMMADEGMRNVGIFILTGAIVNGLSIVKSLIAKWCNLSVLIAIYWEILALAELELNADTVCS